MNGPHPVAIGRGALGEDVAHLTENHAERAGGPGKNPHHLSETRWGKTDLPVTGGGRVGRKDEKGVGQETVAGQNGGRLVEGSVACRLAPAEIVVVHGRKVVVNEGIGMHHFKGAGGRKKTPALLAETLSHEKAETGSEAFPSRKEGMAHRRKETAPEAFGLGDETVQGGVDLTPGRTQIAVEGSLGS